MYPHYKGEMDPYLREDEALEEGNPYCTVECPNGCGFWGGDILTDGCPECGDGCHDVEEC